MVSIPVTAKAAKMGFNALADLQMLGLEYQQTSLAVSEKLIKTQPDLVRNIVKAHVEAIYYAKTHRKETIAILAKYLHTEDPDALQEAYEACVQALIPQKPYPSMKGIQTILRELGTKAPAARTTRPEQLVDVSYIQELDRTGFIDQLYKSSAVVKATPNEGPVQGSVAVKEKTPQENKASATPIKSKQPVSAAGQQYTVKGGDTLGRISERFYNSADKWGKIYEANKDTLKNPNYIYIGQRLTIPPDEQTGI
jgi:LysM repeat protein